MLRHSHDVDFKGQGSMLIKQNNRVLYVQTNNDISRNETDHNDQKEHGTSIFATILSIRTILSIIHQYKHGNDSSLNCCNIKPYARIYEDKITGMQNQYDGLEQQCTGNLTSPGRFCHLTLITCARYVVQSLISLLV